MKTKPKTKAATMAMRIHFSWLNRSRMTLSMENYLSDVSSRASEQKSGRESGSMDSKRTAQSTYSMLLIKGLSAVGSRLSGPAGRRRWPESRQPRADSRYAIKARTGRNGEKAQQ